MCKKKVNPYNLTLPVLNIICSSPSQLHRNCKKKHFICSSLHTSTLKISVYCYGGNDDNNDEQRAHYIIAICVLNQTKTVLLIMRLTFGLAYSTILPNYWLYCCNFLLTTYVLRVSFIVEMFYSCVSVRRKVFIYICAGTSLYILPMYRNTYVVVYILS